MIKYKYIGRTYNYHMTKNNYYEVIKYTKGEDKYQDYITIESDSGSVVDMYIYNSVKTKQFISEEEIRNDTISEILE